MWVTFRACSDQRANVLAGADCLRYVGDSTWWEWEGGS